MKKLLCLTFPFVFTVLATAQTTSTFDTNADGWTFLNNGTPITVNHNTSNGNPGGFIATAAYSSNATATSQGWFAPAKFLGSQVAKSYGMNLRLDLQQSFAGTNSSGFGDVRIVTTSGFVIVFSLPVKPAVAPAWSSYAIKLDETGGWRIASTGGALATKTDVIRALSNITTLEIRGTYITNAANVVGIDNVILEQKTLTVPPTLTSFAPLSGIPGSSLTINGNNFGATAAQNSVYFGTTKATITSVSATQLSVTIPAGAQYGPITVINTSTGLVIQSTNSFTPLFNNNGDIGGRIIPSSLDLKDNLTLDPTHGIQGLSLGDLDGDGLVDMIVSETGPSNLSEISYFRNLGVTGDINASSFGPRTPLTRGWGENTLTDLDGDGKLDIVVIDTDFVSLTYIVTYRNISTPGTIAFEPSESFVNPSFSNSKMHVADIDGDGRPDVMATNANSPGGFWTLQNLSTPGDIQLAAGVAWDNLGSSGISSGDLDGDGKVEIVVVEGTSRFRIFRNQSTPGTISLAAPSTIDPVNNIYNVIITDLDNDGKKDLMWGSAAAATAIRIRKNIYSGGALDNTSFDTEVTISSTAFAAEDIAIADMNADGKLDIVATNVRNLAIFQGNFNGTLTSTSFMEPVLFQGNAFDQFPRIPVIADLDGDNKPDVVSTSNSNPTQIFIYRNTCFPVPVVNNVSPASGQVGTSLTVTGDLMNTNLEIPKVKVGSISTTAGSIGNTSLTASIPEGALSSRVSVTLHGLTTYSKPVTVTFPTARTINAGSFTAPVEFPLATVVDGLTTADFDDDGKTDVVVNDNNTFRIFRNTIASNGSSITTGSLSSIATTYTGTAGLTSTDIDGDGKTDLIANTFMHRNNAGATADAISFEPQIQHIITGTGLVVNHDFNHDGKSDFAYMTGNNYQVEENASRNGPFTNLGGGVFSTIVNASINVAAGGQVEELVSDDFDGDGYDDLAFGVNAGADFLSVVRNTGLNQAMAPGQFETAVTFPALDLPYSIAASDFDGDGKVDIVLGNLNAAFISVYRNTSTVGTIGFQAKQDIAALTRAIDIEAVDLDGDGKAEIIVAHQPSSTTGSFTVFQNTSTSGTISFAAGINYTLTRGPLSLAIADINRDTKPDLIFTANGTTDDALMIFENKIVSAPSITSFTPASGPVGTTVVITGTNFSATPANNTVTFNGITATVTASTTTSITVTVPVNATTGSIAVTVAGNTATSATAFNVTTTPPPLLTITSFTPASGPVGTVVTIIGTNFSTTPSNNTVMFNGTNATITASTSTSITTTVPANATTGKITVTVGGTTVQSVTDFTITVPVGSSPVITAATGSATIGGVATINLLQLLTDADNNLDLSTLKIVLQPGSGVPATIDANRNLVIDYTGHPFAGTDEVTIEVCDLTVNCTQRILTVEVGGNIEVYNAISPNGDGKNDVFVIEHIELFPDTKSNKVTIYNRWGSAVFEITDYDNVNRVFKGEGDSKNELPTGVYFYKIQFSSSDRATENGYLVLKR